MPLSRRDLLRGAAVAGAGVALASRTDAREVVTSPPHAVGMLFDATLCIGCRACVRKCKEVNGLPEAPTAGEGMPTDLDCNTKNIIKRVQDGDRRTLVKRQCMHCVDPSCVSVCMMGALHKEGEGKRHIEGERKGSGIVLYDRWTCVGCRYCQIACPYLIPKFEWEAAFPKIVKCELCRHRADPDREGPLSMANPACAEVCPRGAVVYGERAQLLAEAHRRLATEPGRYNPRVYGEVEGGGTAVLYLAPSGFDFQMMGLPDLPEESPAKFSESTSHAPYLNGVTPVALYATVIGLMRWREKKSKGETGEEDKR